MCSIWNLDRKKSELLGLCTVRYHSEGCRSYVQEKSECVSLDAQGLLWVLTYSRKALFKVPLLGYVCCRLRSLQADTQETKPTWKCSSSNVSQKWVNLEPYKRNKHAYSLVTKTSLASLNPFTVHIWMVCGIFFLPPQKNNSGARKILHTLKPYGILRIYYCSHCNIYTL